MWLNWTRDTGPAPECSHAESLHEVVLDDSRRDFHLVDECPWVLLTLNNVLPAEAEPSKPTMKKYIPRFRNMNAPYPAPGERVRHLSTEEIEQLQMLGRTGFHADAIVQLCRRAFNITALREIRRQVVLAEDALSQGIQPGRESQGILPDEKLLGVIQPVLAAVRTALDECSSAKSAHVVRRKILDEQGVTAETQARYNQAVDDLFVASRKGFQWALWESVVKLQAACEA